MKRSKYNDLIKNIFYFAISSFAPKILVFLLVPLYTNCLTTDEYGIVDLIGTTVALIYPFVILGISDAVLKFTVNDTDSGRAISIGFYWCTGSTLLLSVLLFLAYCIDIFPLNFLYLIYTICNITTTVFYALLMSYIRGIGAVKVIATTSILSTCISVSSNLILLLKFKLGVYGYMISNILGTLSIVIYIYFKCNIRKVLIRPNRQDIVMFKKMIQYGIPLIFSNIAWWINSVSDRYIITFFCGAGDNGIYTVASKIPSILAVLQGIFSEAWQLSTFKEYDKAGSTKFFEKIFHIYFFLMCLCCSILIILDIPLAKFLYAKEFFSAWKCVPFLLLSNVFIAMAGFESSILQAMGSTKKIASTTIMGAVINLGLNMLVIPYFGIVGASITTAIGFGAMWISRVYQVQKKLKIQRQYIKVVAVICLLIIQSILLLQKEHYYTIQIVCLFFIVCLYVKMIANLVNQGIQKMKNIKRERR